MKINTLFLSLALALSVLACDDDVETGAPVAGMTAPVAGMTTPVAGMTAPVAGMTTPIEPPLPMIPMVPSVDCSGSSAESPCVVSIQQARSAGLVPAETIIQIEGVVSATRLNEEGATSHLVIQAEDGGALSGIWTYVNDARVELAMIPTEGQRVRVTAQTADYFGQRQLQKIEALEVLGSAVVPLPVTLAPEQLATMSEFGPYFEGVLVAVEGVDVLELNPPAGPGDSDPTNEFVVTGGLRVDDYLTQHSAPLPLPMVGDRFTRIVGVLRLANNDLKIEPRYAADLSR